jgi:hypothetical protein
MQISQVFKGWFLMQISQVFKGVQKCGYVGDIARL